MDREEERKAIETAQAQEWAKRHMEYYEPRWSRKRVFGFCLGMMMSCVICWMVWMGLIK